MLWCGAGTRGFCSDQRKVCTAGTIGDDEREKTSDSQLRLGGGKSTLIQRLLLVVEGDRSFELSMYFNNMRRWAGYGEG